MAALDSINLNRLAVFTAVAEAGSFTAAAERLGLTKAMVSQHLARLEAELGVALLIRSTRRLSLTEAGAAFFADCVQLLEAAEAAIGRVHQGQDAPSGTLRLTAPVDYGTAVVAPALTAFSARYPAVQVDFQVTDTVMDLVAERFDLGIRIGWLGDSRLRAATLGRFDQVLVGAPSYLARHGTPRQPADLTEHRFVALSLLRSPLTWTFQDAAGTSHPVRVQSSISTNTSVTVQAFVRAGAGIAVLPSYAVAEALESGELVSLLHDFSLTPGGVYAVYPAVRHTPAKVRAFIAFFKAHLAERGMSGEGP